jgi:hypothetical protein
MFRFKLRTLLIVLLSSIALPLSGQETPDPAAALFGEWQVVEMIYRGTVQDFGGGPGGWFIFHKEGVIIIPDADADAKLRNDTNATKVQKTS